jgi:hypothetical protein
LHDTPIHSCQTAIWYKTMHGILRTNVRLHKINMSSTDKCRYCDTQDTILHRLIKCRAGQLMWTWTANKMATVLRTAARYIPPSWTIRPNCTIWPPTRRRAVLWFLAQLASFRHDRYNSTTLQEYISYVRLRKEILYNHPKRRTLVANYLIVVEDST